jgi:DNA-binding CsgD family transcriptional regulator
VRTSICDFWTMPSVRVAREWDDGTRQPQSVGLYLKPADGARHISPASAGPTFTPDAKDLSAFTMPSQCSNKIDGVASNRILVHGARTSSRTAAGPRRPRHPRAGSAAFRGRHHWRQFTITYQSATRSFGSHTTLLLTPLERAVLQLLADGRPNHEIADRLSVVEQEVDARLTHLFEKMGASSRQHAIAVALRRGLVIERLS